MPVLLTLGATSFLLCLVLTPLCRDFFLKYDIVDVPDGTRKLHGKSIPRVGGVPIALSYIGALAMLLLAPRGLGISVQHTTLLYSLLPAAGMVFVTGLLDDLRGLKPSHKLIGQCIAAIWAVSAGVRITLWDGHPYGELLTFPLSVLWLVACSNAFNLIDGLDGLASGVGLFATFTTLLVALLQGNSGLALATIPLVGCLLAFLRFNFNPASIFLGDCGSLSIGFSLGCFSLIWSQKSETLASLLAPAMALALPLLDVGLSISRRFLRNRPIFSADRGHIHHRLLDIGFKPRSVALILYGVCGIAAILSVLQSSLSQYVGGFVILVFCVLCVIGVHRLQYVEFSAANRILSGGRMLGLVRNEIHLGNFRSRLTMASGSQDCWSTIRDACKEMDFVAVELRLDGKLFEEVFDSTAGETDCWQFSANLRNHGTMKLSARQDGPSLTLTTSFLDVLMEGLEAKRLQNTEVIALKKSGVVLISSSRDAFGHR